MSERALCFLHSHCLCPSSRAFPSPTPLLYVDSPLITFKQPSGPLMQPAASVETVCYRTKDTLFLCKQHPSSTDLFMCQVDSGDTPFLVFSLRSWNHIMKVVSILPIQSTHSTLKTVHTEMVRFGHEFRNIFTHSKNTFHKLKLFNFFLIGQFLLQRKSHFLLKKMYIRGLYDTFDRWTNRTLFEVTYGGIDRHQ